MAGTATRSALWLVLGGWVGSWGCFGLVVAPAAFRLLPTTELAGQLVSPILTTLHIYGVFAGLALAALARIMGRGRFLVVMPLVLAALCVFTHFWVSAQISAVRPLAFGPEGTLDMAARFTQLHQLSLGIFIAISAATILLVIRHAREDARESGRSGEKSL